MKKHRPLILIIVAVLLFLSLSACGAGTSGSVESSTLEPTLPEPELPIISSQPQNGTLPELTLDSPSDVAEGSYRLLETPMEQGDMELNTTRLCGGTPVEAYRTSLRKRRRLCWREINPLRIPSPSSRTDPCSIFLNNPEKSSRSLMGATAFCDSQTSGHL